MKRACLYFLVILTFLFSPSIQAYAGSVSVGDIISWDGVAGPSGGGEMRFIDKTTNQTFWTFCLEETINISSANYQVASISNNVISGGQGTSEPLNAKTKWLFYHWAMGDLVGYSKNSSTQGEGSLQVAIWNLQGDTGTVFGGYDAAYFLGIAQDGSNLPVYAINPVGPWPGAAADAQSLLIVTPEPLTLLLLGAGLIGLAGLRRKE